MPNVYLSLGSNLGDKAANLQLALAQIGGIIAVSQIYENAAMLLPDAEVTPTLRDLANAVALGADDLLADMAIEGRIEARQIEAFALPRSALIKDEEGLAVFEIVAGKAHRVAVVLAAEDGARVGVSGALDPNRPVVSVGAYELAEGVESEPVFVQGDAASQGVERAQLIDVHDEFLVGHGQA